MTPEQSDKVWLMLDAMKILMAEVQSILSTSGDQPPVEKPTQVVIQMPVPTALPPPFVDFSQDEEDRAYEKGLKKLLAEEEATKKFWTAPPPRSPSKDDLIKMMIGSGLNEDTIKKVLTSYPDGSLPVTFHEPTVTGSVPPISKADVQALLGAPTARA